MTTPLVSFRSDTFLQGWLGQVRLRADGAQAVIDHLMLDLERGKVATLFARFHQIWMVECVEPLISLRTSGNLTYISHFIAAMVHWIVSG